MMKPFPADEIESKFLDQLHKYVTQGRVVIFDPARRTLEEVESVSTNGGAIQLNMWIESRPGLEVENDPEYQRDVARYALIEDGQ